MPELPEVETIVRQLRPLLTGSRIEHVQVLDPRWAAPLSGEELASAIAGRRVLSLERAGKYLHWVLEGQLHLLQHLRMSGAILVDPPEPVQHLRAVVEISGAASSCACAAASQDAIRAAPSEVGAARPKDAEASAAGLPGALRRLRLLITDQRRFGTAELLFGDEAASSFLRARLGPEPLSDSFDARRLWRASRGRTTSIKALLLDQRVVAGIGNIYADEALFRAGIHPASQAGRLTRERAALLCKAIEAALTEGIEAKGASFHDFRHIDGVKGSFQDRFLVHRRAGEPCPTCGAPITKTVVAGRGTYLCQACQRR